MVKFVQKEKVKSNKNMHCSCWNGGEVLLSNWLQLFTSLGFWAASKWITPPEKYKTLSLFLFMLLNTHLCSSGTLSAAWLSAARSAGMMDPSDRLRTPALNFENYMGLCNLSQPLHPTKQLHNMWKRRG